MRKLLSIMSYIVIGASLHAQTCVGTFSFKLFDKKTNKPISEKLEKSIAYAFTIDENEFYDNVQSLITLDSALRSKQGYTIYKNENGYNFFSNTDPSSIAFAARCGVYLVHMDFYGKKDTMSLNIYNIPAHQSFQLDTVLFQSGEYFIDLKASTRLTEMQFQDDKGYFLVPPSMIQPFPKKKEKE